MVGSRFEERSHVKTPKESHAKALIRKVSRQDAKVKRLEIIGDSVNAILEDCFAKVDQEPEAKAGEPQVGEKLLETSRLELLDRFQFQDDQRLVDGLVNSRTKLLVKFNCGVDSFFRNMGSLQTCRNK